MSETNGIDRKRTMEAASNNTWESKAATKRALPKAPPKMTVTYSRLCDGGTQEMSTAVSCVREIFPDATIRTHRRTPEEDMGLSNPEVIIATGDNPNQIVLWSSKQKNLYQKYPKKRKKSMKEIRKALEALKVSRANPTTTAPTTTAPTPPPVPAAPVNEVSEDFSFTTEEGQPPLEIVDNYPCQQSSGGSCPLR